VTAFNGSGPSNSVAIDIDDIANQPPILPSRIGIGFSDSDYEVTVDMTSYNTGAPADSWTLEVPPPQPGSLDPADFGVEISISDDGIFSVSDATWYESVPLTITAFRGTLASNPITLTLILVLND
jgi:hypothetical protein